VHHIDPLLAATVLNKLACNPTKTNKLQGQVQELIDRGYIRESMSPCPIPAILVPKKDRTMRMFLDSCAIDNITIKYRYPIPRLDDMVDELYTSKALSGTNLRSRYH